MRQKVRVFLWAAILITVAGLPCQASLVDTIAGLVSQSSYTAYLDDTLYTQTGDNRGSGAEHDLAQNAIFTAFASFGLTTSLDAFTYSGSTYYNVVGVLPGAVHPDEYFIVGAHYDSVNNPGADDNASGVAGVLEAARVLSQYTYGATIVFIAFDREEQGLVGSSAWAAAHSGDNIQGMISLDMIAYNPAGATYNNAYLYTWDGSTNSVTTGLAYALTTYGGLTPVFAGSAWGSDHYPFGAQGDPSALLIEAAWGSNPNYHQATDSTDTAGYIDYAYATAMTRATVGFLASAADPVPEPSTWALVASALVVLVVFRRVRPRQAHAPQARG